jgi:hypothetical protein
MSEQASEPTTVLQETTAPIVQSVPQTAELSPTVDAEVVTGERESATDVEPNIHDVQSGAASSSAVTLPDVLLPHTTTHTDSPKNNGTEKDVMDTASAEEDVHEKQSTDGIQNDMKHLQEEPNTSATLQQGADASAVQAAGGGSAHIDRPRYTTADRARAVDARRKKKEERLEKIMIYVREHGSIVNDEIQAVADCADNTALLYAKALVKRGALVAKGKGVGRRYVLTSLSQ